MDKIGIIGIGNMGGAIAKALCEEKKNLIIYNRTESDMDEFKGIVNVTIAKSNVDLVKQAKYIIIAVKPVVCPTVAKEIKDYLTDESVVISIAASYTLKKMERLFPGRKIVIGMPNMPAIIKEAMSAICPNDRLNENELKDVIEIFSSFGEVTELDEDKFAAFTAVCGSLPAYIYMFIEAAADAAVLNGMNRKDSYRFIAQTVLGSSKLILEGKEHPAKLKDDVTSPSGTTIEGLKVLEAHGFRSGIIEALNEAAKKYREM